MAANKNTGYYKTWHKMYATVQVLIQRPILSEVYYVSMGRHVHHYVVTRSRDRSRHCYSEDRFAWMAMFRKPRDPTQFSRSIIPLCFSAVWGFTVQTNTTLFEHFFSHGLYLMMAA